MLIDMHAHTSGISHCCRTDAAGVLKAAIEAGIDGLILCNHYQCYKGYAGDVPPAEFAEKYIAEYYHTAKVAAEMGMRLYFVYEKNILPSQRGKYCRQIARLFYGGA